MMDKASPFWTAWADFRQNRVALVALIIVTILVVMAVLSPWVAPQNPYDIASLEYADSRLMPGEIGTGGYAHWFGTDPDGRDMYSAILYGLRTSIEMGLLAGTIALCIGATLGIIAAYAGRFVEVAIMRVIDLQLSFPAVLLALVMTALLGQGKAQLIVALITAQYAYFARTTYGAATSERRKDYVEAALSVPLSPLRIIFRHILPNVLPPLIVVATVQVASAISLEATLSFLGLGLPPTEPSLGTLISAGKNDIMSGRYWISIYPGIALIFLIVSINLVGDQIRDQLNPRLKK